eukprot:GHVP01065815.1.p2 GENE.GHVP01065815.1~~GHVP01065815.1.p2  ORF type:complete len:674 (+),score=84.83 GHVP01065815.1:296-2317(+)
METLGNNIITIINNQIQILNTDTYSRAHLIVSLGEGEHPHTIKTVDRLLYILSTAGSLYQHEGSQTKLVYKTELYGVMEDILDIAVDADRKLYVLIKEQKEFSLRRVGLDGDVDLYSVDIKYPKISPTKLVMEGDFVLFNEGKRILIFNKKTEEKREINNRYRITTYEVRQNQISFGDTKGEIRIYSFDTDIQYIARYHWHSREVSSIKFLSEREMISGGKEGVLVKRDMYDREKIQFIPRLGSEIQTIEILKEEYVVYTEDKRIHIIDPYSFSIKRSINNSEVNKDNIISINEDKTLNLGVGMKIYFYSLDGNRMDGELDVFDHNKGYCVQNIMAKKMEIDSACREKDTIIVGCSIGMGIIIKMFIKDQLMSSIVYHSLSPIDKITIQGDLVITIDRSGEGARWLIRDGVENRNGQRRELVRIDGFKYRDSGVRDICISRDGRSILGICRNRIVQWRLYNYGTEIEYVYLIGNGFDIRSMNYIDERRFYYVTDREVGIIDLIDRNIVGTIKINIDSVISVGYQSDFLNGYNRSSLLDSNETINRPEEEMNKGCSNVLFLLSKSRYMRIDMKGFEVIDVEEFEKMEIESSVYYGDGRFLVTDRINRKIYLLNRYRKDIESIKEVGSVSIDEEIEEMELEHTKSSENHFIDQSSYESHLLIGNSLAFNDFFKNK